MLCATLALATCPLASSCTLHERGAARSRGTRLARDVGRRRRCRRRPPGVRLRASHARRRDRLRRRESPATGVGAAVPAPLDAAACAGAFARPGGAELCTRWRGRPLWRRRWRRHLRHRDRRRTMLDRNDFGLILRRRRRRVQISATIRCTSSESANATSSKRGRVSWLIDDRLASRAGSRRGRDSRPASAAVDELRRVRRLREPRATPPDRSPCCSNSCRPTRRPGCRSARPSLRP